MFQDKLTSLVDLNIVTAHLALAHLAIFRERPVLQTIASFPLHLVMRILILIPELYSDLIVGEGKELFAKAVILLFVPLLGQKMLNCSCTREERGAIPPNAVGSIRFCDGLWVPIDVNLGKEIRCTLPTGHSKGLELS